MRISTDDGPRKLRAVWLGPKGKTLPVEWTFVQWGVTVGLWLLLMAGFGWLWWLLTHNPLVAAVSGVAWGVLVGTWLAVRIMHRVTFDEPLRYHREQLIAGLRLVRHGRIPRGRQTMWAAPVVGGVSAGVARAMGWTEQEVSDGWL
ncbi:MAG: hypothetical protein ACOH1Y_10095 [Propionicimonas sp.]